MKDLMKMAIKLFAIMICLIFILNLTVATTRWMITLIELNKVLNKASVEGKIDSTYYTQCMNQTGFGANITLTRAVPSLDTLVGKLGDPIKLVVTYNHPLNVLDYLGVSVPLPVWSNTVNEGYYGSGY